MFIVLGFDIGEYKNDLSINRLLIKVQLISVHQNSERYKNYKGWI